MEIKIDSSIKEKVPYAKLQCILYTTLVKEKNENLWKKFEGEIFPALIESFSKNSFNDIKNLDYSKKAYKKLGKDPGRYRVSSEALYRRIKQGKGIYQINTVVDANNLISLETGFSVGSYDIDKIEGDILWRVGKEGESYKGIGKENLNIENLPLLSDKKGAFGSPTSDSERAMITLESKNILTVIYDFSEEDKSEELLKTAEKYLKEYAEAEIKERFTIK